ncbi:hypothetical protein ACWFR1_26650 [Streptomyces sp. NPDC055103]
MSISPSIPVAQGRGKTSLQYEGDALLLTRRHDEVRIPLAAIAQVRAEGRRLTVELTAAPGAASYKHQVDGVSKAAVAMFAATVNAALPGTAGRDTAADGTALVETRDRHVSRHQRKVRLIKWWSTAAFGAVVALCALVAAAGEPMAILFFVLIGPVGAASCVASGMALASWYREVRLTRHGITTFAAEVPERPGMYLYVDPAGAIRHVFTWAGGMAVRVSYDPRDPGNVILPRRAFLRRGELCLGLFLGTFGLASYALLIGMTVEAFLGTLDL